MGAKISVFEFLPLTVSRCLHLKLQVRRVRSPEHVKNRTTLIKLHHFFLINLKRQTALWFNHLRKLRKLFIRQHGDVAEQFMAAVSVGAGRTGSEPQAADRTCEWKRAEGGRELTAQASAWGRTGAGCTACTETLGRPNRPGSLWLTAGRRRDAAGSPFSLQNQNKERSTHLLSGFWKHKNIF